MTDVAIVGAGILGLATAREILLRRPGLRLTVLEKESIVAAHQTGHNSGVIHSGIYYAPGALTPRDGAWHIGTSAGEVRARAVISCAGLHADLVAAMTGAPRAPRIIPFRGQYWRLRTGPLPLVRGLIYPVPDPGFPFLGVHFTPRMDGEVWLGPNATLALAVEGYR